VGAWKELLEHQANNDFLDKFGQQYTCAMMYACILNDRYDKARMLIPKAMPKSLDENNSQENVIIDPFLRDIIIQVSGSLPLYREARNQGFQLSIQALSSVIKYSPDTKDFVEVLKDICKGTDWIVQNDCFEILQWQSKNDTRQILMDECLLIVLQNCNHRQEFGLALMLYEFLSPHFLARGETWQGDIIHYLSNCHHQDRLLAAIMTSLCGLDLPHIASFIRDGVVQDKDKNNFKMSSKVLEYSDSLIPLPSPWEIAHTLLMKTVYAIKSLKSEKSTPGDLEVNILLASLAKTAEACTTARHPEAALFLMRQVYYNLVKPTSENNSMSDDESMSMEALFFSKDDALLAEYFRAQRIQGTSKNALVIWQHFLELSSLPYTTDYPLTVNEITQMFFLTGQVHKAIELFQSMNTTALTPDIFVSVAKGLEAAKNWIAIIDLHRLSIPCGCFSESLGIIVMKAYLELPKFEGKIKEQRKIVRQISELSGMHGNDWLYRRYWNLKHTLGIRCARTLLWWNDPKTSDLYELQFAMEQFRKTQEEGLRPKLEVLRAIVRHCQQYNRLSWIVSKHNIKMSLEKEVLHRLLQDVIIAMRNTPLQKDRSFAEQMILALQCVKAQKLQDNFVSEITERGIRIDPYPKLKTAQLSGKHDSNES
jgi:hypothetical protein